MVEGASGAVDHTSFREGVCEAALRVFATHGFSSRWRLVGSECPGDLVRKRPKNRRAAWWRSSPAATRH